MKWIEILILFILIEKTFIVRSRYKLGTRIYKTPNKTRILQIYTVKQKTPFDNFNIDKFILNITIYKP